MRNVNEARAFLLNYRDQIKDLKRRLKIAQSSNQRRRTGATRTSNGHQKTQYLNSYLRWYYWDRSGHLVVMGPDRKFIHPDDIYPSYMNNGKRLKPTNSSKAQGRVWT
jgi:hypothetical protein